MSVENKRKIKVIIVVVLIFIVTIIVFAFLSKRSIFNDSTKLEKIIDIKGKKELITYSINHVPYPQECKDDIYRNKKNVFYRGEKIFNANPDKFQSVDWSNEVRSIDSNLKFSPNKNNYFSGLFKDDKNLYFFYEEKFYVVENINPNDVRILEGGDYQGTVYSFLISGENVYSYFEQGLNISYDAFSLAIKTKFILNKDKGTVKFPKLNVSDAESFELVDGNAYNLFAKDKNNIYFIRKDGKFKVFENSKPMSFVCDFYDSRKSYCKDTDSLYFGDGNSYNAKESGVDLESFKYISDYPSIFRDKNNFYYIFDLKINKFDLNIKTVWYEDIINGGDIFDDNHTYVIYKEKPPELIFKSEETIDYKFYPYYLLVGNSVWSYNHDEIKKVEGAKSKSFSVFYCNKFEYRDNFICGKDQKNNYYINGEKAEVDKCTKCDIKENYEFKKPEN